MAEVFIYYRMPVQHENIIKIHGVKKLFIKTNINFKCYRCILDKNIIKENYSGSSDSDSDY